MVTKLKVAELLGTRLDLIARPMVELLQIVELARNVRRVAVKDRRVAFRICQGGAMMMTCAVKFSQLIAGLFFAYDATCPRRMSLTVTFQTLNTTLSSSFASASASWCVPTDLH